MLLNGAAQIKERATQQVTSRQTHLPGNGAFQSSDNCVASWFSSINCFITRFSDSFVC
jgi:hypothetical protein